MVTIVRDPIFTLQEGATAAVDLSCHVVAVEPGEDVETIDVGTFCAPGATEVGRVTSTLTVAFLWSPELYDALSPLKGKELAMVLKPNQADTEAVQATVKFDSMPWGRFEVGQRVEADLTFAVLGDGFTYGAVTPAP